MTKHLETTKSAQTESTAQSDVEQHERMRSLIAELVKTNQELRFRVGQLKEKIERLEKGSADDIPWAGMLI